MHSRHEIDVKLRMADLTVMQKQIVGASTDREIPGRTYPGSSTSIETDC